MENINAVVIKLFVATDQRDWAQVEKCFASVVGLDYSSMTGNPVQELTPSAIVESWKSILPGFQHTHHQLGNFITEVNADFAHVFCYGTATHYLPDDKGDLWTVVGSYDFELVKGQNNVWRISKMKFNFKYQDGNSTLPAKAMSALKK